MSGLSLLQPLVWVPMYLVTAQVRVVASSWNQRRCLENQAVSLPLPLSFVGPEMVDPEWTLVPTLVPTLVLSNKHHCHPPEHHVQSCWLWHSSNGQEILERMPVPQAPENRG